MSRIKRLIPRLLLAAFLVWVVIAALLYLRLRREGYKTRTYIALRELSTLLSEMDPNEVKARGLEAVAREAGYQYYLVDGWNRPIELESPEQGPGALRLLSLGRDGRKGACCTEGVSSPEEDVVLDIIDSEVIWRQRWRD